ncbi:MAG: radical SAM protein [Bacteriovoracaceae bacterium]|nr:radical SAM protein [Bacteriovoracaceae bacterium]
MFFGQPITYEEPVFRPPSEWRSLLIQVTIGCSNNKCTYCDMYRSKTYRVRNLDDIKKDLQKCADSGMAPDKIFLCDGDALGAPMEVLEATLDTINELFPDVRRIGVYATAENILEKSEEELKRLADKKLNIAYLGLESGDDKVLHMIVKGNTAEDMVKASLKIKSCGFKLSTIAMLGVGGKKYSQQHIENTAKVISQTNPEFFSFLTTFAVPGTPYHTMVERGLIEPLTSKELLIEMHDILELSSFDLNSVIFRANHVSNAHPLGGTLPKDKEKILKTIKGWIDQTPEGLYPTAPERM